MSVCDDERWKDENWTPGWVHWCPCYRDLESNIWCGLSVFEMHSPFGAKGKKQDLRPDTCPFAPILKALPTASEEALEAALLQLNDFAGIPREEER